MMITDRIFFHFLFLVALSLLISLAYAFISLAPWVPTRRRDLERINNLAGLRQGDVFYEIGCGTAVVASYIAKNNPQSRVVGIELALPLYIFAKTKKLFCGPGNLDIRFGDAFQEDYTDADVVYIFGLPETVSGRMKDKLEKELKPGAKFISYSFEVTDWNGSRSFCDKPTPRDAGIYICEK